MLSGRKIDERFLDRWERDVCFGLQHCTGRPFVALRDGAAPRQTWLIDPVLASVCAHQPSSCGYVVRFEPQDTGSKLWVGVGVMHEPVLGEFLSESFRQAKFIASVRPLFRKLDAMAFMGQNGWVRSTMTSQDGTCIALKAPLLDQVASIYAPTVSGAEFMAAEVYRTYDTADDMETDTERVANLLVEDFGPLYNGLFPRSITR
jgi:hypothetical protein